MRDDNKAGKVFLVFLFFCFFFCFFSFFLFFQRLVMIGFAFISILYVFGCVCNISKRVESGGANSTESVRRLQHDQRAHVLHLHALFTHGLTHTLD